MRNIRWKNNLFLDALYWLPPWNLAGLAKTWLGKDLKDMFPHNAVTEELAKKRDAVLDNLTTEEIRNSLRISIGLRVGE